MDDQQLVPAFQKVLQTKGIMEEDSRIELLVPIIKPRISFVHELWEECWFFFEAPGDYDEKVLKKRWKEDTPEKMMHLVNHLEKCEPFSAPNLESSVKELITSMEWGMGAIMNAWRLLLVGAARGPGLFDLAAFIGREEVISRMKQGIETIGEP
jgi:glutamyl-tRNA synthetase